MYELRRRHDDRRLLLPILIFRPSPPTDLDGVPVTALVDTGATNSGITPRIVEQLELETYGKRLLGSARSQEQVPRYIFRIGLAPAVEEGGPTLLPVIFECDGFELRSGAGFDALLGMDVLSQCDISLTRDRHFTIRFD